MGGDSQLKKHVEDELSWQPSVDEVSIGVSVKDAIRYTYGPCAELRREDSCGARSDAHSGRDGAG